MLGGRHYQPGSLGTGVVAVSCQIVDTIDFILFARLDKTVKVKMVGVNTPFHLLADLVDIFSLLTAVPILAVNHVKRIPIKVLFTLLKQIRL